MRSRRTPEDQRATLPKIENTSPWSEDGGSSLALPVVWRRVEFRWSSVKGSCRKGKLLVGRAHERLLLWLEMDACVSLICGGDEDDFEAWDFAVFVRGDWRSEVAPFCVVG